MNGMNSGKSMLNIQAHSVAFLLSIKKLHLLLEFSNYYNEQNENHKFKTCVCNHRAAFGWM